MDRKEEGVGVGRVRQEGGQLGTGDWEGATGRGRRG